MCVCVLSYQAYTKYKHRPKNGLTEKTIEKKGLGLCRIMGDRTKLKREMLL